MDWSASSSARQLRIQQGPSPTPLKVCTRLKYCSTCGICTKQWMLQIGKGLLSSVLYERPGSQPIMQS